MQNSYAFLGNSGVGKDTAAQVIQPATLLHPIGYIKRFWENYYNFPKGTFDTKEGKELQLSPTSPYTVGEFQLKLYEFFKTVDPCVSLYGFASEIVEAMETDTNLVFTGIRSLGEAKLIHMTLPQTHWVVIERKGYDGLASDKQLKQILRYVLSTNDSLSFILNCGSKEDLIEKVKTLPTQKNE